MQQKSALGITSQGLSATKEIFVTVHLYMKTIQNDIQESKNTMASESCWTTSNEPMYLLQKLLRIIEGNIRDKKSQRINYLLKNVIRTKPTKVPSK